MADITEEAKWENSVYELAVADDIIGGTDGVDNLPHKQLANRTAWLKQQFDNLAVLPVGAIIIWPTATPPAGCLECDGSALSRTTYARLFAIIGTTYGTGAGTLANKTFRLPDGRGEFIRGWDHGRGVDASRTIGSNQADALQNITGKILRPNMRGAGTGAFLKTASNYHSEISHSQGAENFALDFNASRVARTSTETRPRNIAMMYVIKY